MAGSVAARAAFLEREGELARIERRLAAACDGHGGVLAVEGAAGIGKTSLLAATRTLAEAAGMRVLRARGAELEREFAFGVVRQLFEPPLAEASADERAALLDGAAALAGRLLGRSAAVPDDGAREAADSSFAVLHGLYWVCANLAAERPLCLIVDDAHWADAPSLRFLAFLQPRLEELGVALVLAARPGEGGAGQALLTALTGDATAEIVRPAALSVDGVALVIEERLGAPPDHGFVVACQRATGGNPFLLGQLVLALAEDGVAPTQASTARIETLGARWAAHWILLRLGRLPGAAAQLARALAILERGDLVTASALAGLGADEAVGAADALVAAGILAPGRPLAFVHPIVRTGIYTDIGTAERARAHREAARLLADAHAADELVVEHLLASEPAADAWVAERLVAAARAAARSGAPELAAVYLRRALAEPPARSDRAGLLLELGVAEDNAGQREARTHMEAAMAVAEDPPSRFAAALVLGHALARDNRFPEALEILDRSAAASDPGDERRRRAAEALAASIATFSVSTAEAHADRIRSARAIVDTDRSCSHEQLALAGQLAVRSNEPAAVAAGLARRALTAARGAMPEPTDLPWFHQCAVTLLWSECFEELRVLLDEAVASARSRGDASLFTGALAYRGWLALRRGDLSAAEADARTAIEAANLPAPAMYRLRSAAVLVEALVEQGQLEEAEQVLAPIETDLQGDSTIAANLRVSRGRLRIAQRRAEEGLADLLRAGTVATATDLICPGCVPWRSEAALAQLTLGHAASARKLAGEELELARAFAAPRALGVALRGAGLAAGGEPGEALLRESVAILERADARLELARARADLGAFLRRSKRRAEARTFLSEALDGAHRAGARPLAERAETELRATGAKPRRVMLTGVESLTASERRVAELAAEGLTNREIAQALFVTMRTVEGHLTRVFGKLDLSSRDQLTAALAEEVLA
jgi:DNA-binding CsgD family transcriptional regulator